MVYSTCSFNPIENEAVVAAALELFKDKVQIVDVSKEVSPHLRYRPGMVRWTVLHRGKGKLHPPEFYQSWSSVEDWKRKLLKESMFHSTYTNFNNEPLRKVDGQYKDPLNLKNCLRLYPHDDN